jgi:putative PIN family toxin of toxin-antitoxin system
MRVLRLVLDTNIWLDWLVFADPVVIPIRDAVAGARAAVYIDERCEAELERVLAYDLGKHSVDAAAQAACLAACRCVSLKIEAPVPGELQVRLPTCRDPDDQKFLQAALAARADFLITKDLALLELARRRLPFRILTPQAFAKA